MIEESIEQVKLKRCENCKRLVIPEFYNRGCWLHGSSYQIEELFPISINYERTWKRSEDKSVKSS